jgi:FkbM family methyltransferase
VIGDQLRALTRQTRGDFEVVVVLNRCTDDTREVADGFASALSMTVMTADHKASAAYARNAGAEASTGARLLFCDADDRVGAEWVQEMASALDRADVVGGNVVLDIAVAPRWITDNFYGAIRGAELPTHDQRVPYPLGACLGVRRTRFEGVGGFHESFVGAGGEEIDLTIRLVQSGARVGSAPRAVCLYRPRTTFRGLAAQRSAYARGGALLAARHGYQPGYRGVWREGFGIPRAVAHLALRSGECHPKALAMAATVRFQLIREAHRLPDGVPSEVSSGADFVVPLPVAVIGGLALRAANRISARWYAREGIERLSLEVVARLLDPDSSVVDCGANVGTFTVCAALSVGPDGRVVAFEPADGPRSALEANCTRHGISHRVEIRAQGVGRSAGTAAFNEYPTDLVSGMLRSPFSDDEPMVRTVDLVALDEAVLGPVDLLKVDVEGLELDVLDGARSLLSGSEPPVVLIEINPAALSAGGRSVSELLDRFPQPEWTSWLVTEAIRDQRQAIQPLDAHARRLIDCAGDRWYGNLLVAPRGRAAKVQQTVEDVLDNDRRGGRG